MSVTEIRQRRTLTFRRLSGAKRMRPTFDIATITSASRDDCVAILTAVAARIAQLAEPAPVPTGKLVTAKEAAAELSMPLDSLYAAARTGRVPCVRIGRSMRFDLAAVRRALQADALHPTSLLTLRTNEGCKV